MDRLQSQMRELVECQGKATKKFVEEKLKNFIGATDIDIIELEKTINQIKVAIEADEDTFKLINGIIDTNQNKLQTVLTSIDEIKIVQKTLGDNIIIVNRTTKECLRIIEEDLVLNVSELCSLYSNSLNSIDVETEEL